MYRVTGRSKQMAKNAQSARNDFGSAWQLSALVEAEDLAAFMRALGLERSHVVGYSYGAFIALCLVLEHPELVRSLVFAEPPVLRWAIDIPRRDEEIFRLWNEHGLWLDALDRLRQTLCHNDAFRRNLFARRGAHEQPETVAIDWALVGTGSVGQELGPLVAGTPEFREVAIAQQRNWTQWSLMAN
jgi:pimeloyl-ACP methyl ester carboxylesterase